MTHFSRLIQLSALSSSLLLAGTAGAEEYYVYGSIGATETTHSIERNLGPNPPTLPSPDAGGVSTVSETGPGYLIGAGVRTHLHDGPLFVGAEAYYGLEDAQSRNINGVLVTDLDLNARYGARALLGVDVADNLSLYTHAGVAYLDYDLTNSYTFAPPVRERSDRESGFSYGVGASYRLSDRLSLFADYTKVSEVDFNGIPEIAGGTGRVNRNTLALDTLSTGLRWSF